ncbi:hypothetical protein [Nocardia yamanashiensis]|uniref:hypothetical protein n=1 Tax=Nocardia yamanashiensis TaxID=209247 RepID=UPI000A700EEE|nr:hypothetical protein [Nocardia yamanashiensis]
MKTRKSTAILLTVWIATFVLYLFVKPDTQSHTDYTPIVNTMLSNHLPGTAEPSAR